MIIELRYLFNSFSDEYHLRIFLRRGTICCTFQNTPVTNYILNKTSIMPMCFSDGQRLYEVILRKEF